MRTDTENGKIMRAYAGKTDFKCSIFSRFSLITWGQNNEN